MRVAAGAGGLGRGVAASRAPALTAQSLSALAGMLTTPPRPARRRAPRRPTDDDDDERRRARLPRATRPPTTRCCGGGDGSPTSGLHSAWRRIGPALPIFGGAAVRGERERRVRHKSCCDDPLVPAARAMKTVASASFLAPSADQVLVDRPVATTRRLFARSPPPPSGARGLDAVHRPVRAILASRPTRERPPRLTGRDRNRQPRPLAEAASTRPVFAPSTASRSPRRVGHRQQLAMHR